MEPRSAFLLVGKKSYSLRTTLDEASLKEVYGVLHDAVAQTDPAMEQDERLFLASISLANEIVDLQSKLDEIASMLRDIRGLWQEHE